MTPPRARTWGRIGQTPVVRVRGRGSGRLSMMGMCCFKPGARSRLIYGLREYRGRKDEPKGFGWRDFCRLLTRAHLQLGGPILLVWDNVRLHLTRGCAPTSKRTPTDRHHEFKFSSRPAALVDTALAIAELTAQLKEFDRAVQDVQVTRKTLLALPDPPPPSSPTPPVTKLCQALLIHWRR